MPVNTKRLVVVLTWDEPAPAQVASRAVTYDLDLWADHNVDCPGACGEFASRSTVDNVEYLVIDNPPAGPYRLKVVPVNAPIFPLRYGMTAMIIRGDTTPAMTASLTPPATSPLVGSIFEVQMSVATPHYVASGVQVQPASIPSGVTLLSVNTRRHDGLSVGFPNTEETLTLGNLIPNISRRATYFFRADTPGPKTFFARAWSENGGEKSHRQHVVQVQPLAVDWWTTALGRARPLTGARRHLSVTETVRLSGGGVAHRRTSYYLSSMR